jgi:O-methyltransferase
VVSGAAELLAAADVADRARIVGGSFFESVPGGADAYVLKNIVHDWLEDEAAAILRVCRRHVPANAVLLLIERVIPGPNQGLDASLSDLNMLVSAGGEERTEAEYATLLAAAGFRLTRVVPTTSDVSIVEAVVA